MPKDPQALRASIEAFVAAFKGDKIDYVAGTESCRFIIGGAVAERPGVGFIPLRKRGQAAVQ